MDLRKIPYFAEIKRVIYDGRFDAYFVGGCVRDVILDRPVQDVDLVCFSHDYQEFAKAMKGVLPSVWVEFKDNIRLVRGRFVIDISNKRGDTLEEDMRRRDFTINSLFMDSEGNVTGDTYDLEQKILRHVSETAFTDDPLRILRAYRFHAQLGFRMAKETVYKIMSEKHMLAGSASERIFAELDKLFAGAHAGSSLAKMIETGVFEIITGGVPHADSDVTVAETCRGLTFFMSALFARLNDEDKNTIADRLNLPNSMRKRALRTARFAAEIAKILRTDDPNAIRRLIYLHPEETDDGLKLYEILSLAKGVDGYAIEESVDSVMTQLKYVDFDLPEKLNGMILQEIGIPPGPLMGEIIKSVKPMMASGEISSLEDAEKYITEKYLRGEK